MIVNTNKVNNDEGREVRFVKYVLTQGRTNKGIRAALKRADNLSTEYQSWDILSLFVNLEFKSQRMAYALIAAALARSDVPANGSLLLGGAIAKVYDDGNANSQAKMRLRRLLVCASTEEVCRVLRPLIMLIQSRVKEPLDYVSLLKDLFWFDNYQKRVKAQWAQQFYGYRGEQYTDQKDSL